MKKARVLRITVAGMALLMFSSLLRAETDPSAAVISLREGWACVFGGERILYHARVDAQADAGEARLAWLLSADGRTLARGEGAVVAGREIAIDFELPAMKPGVVLRGQLALTAMDTAGHRLGETNRNLWVFSRDAFAEKQEWLKTCALRLFDPVGKTAECFTKAGVPFVAIDHLEEIPEQRGHLVVVGEDVNWDANRGLATVVEQAATGGVRVLCLAPASAQLPIQEEAPSELPVAQDFSLRPGSVITELDKRLDAEAWPPDGKLVAARLALQADRGRVLLATTEETQGWPWADLHYKGDGRLVLCGFGIVRAWEAGPCPRYLFLSVVENLTKKNTSR